MRDAEVDPDIDIAASDISRDITPLPTPGGTLTPVAEEPEAMLVHDDPELQHFLHDIQEEIENCNYGPDSDQGIGDNDIDLGWLDVALSDQESSLAYLLDDCPYTNSYHLIAGNVRIGLSPEGVASDGSQTSFHDEDNNLEIPLELYYSGNA